MRTFLCLCCGEVYDETVENKDYVLGNSYGSNIYPCPKVHCGGSVIEVDEFLVSVIRNLIDLGFNTLACCSGHSQDDSVLFGSSVRTYIMLEKSLNSESLSEEELELIALSLPEDVIIENDSYDGMDRFIISITSECNSEAESFMQIAKHCSLLLNWTEKILPNVVKQMFVDNDNFIVLSKSYESEFIGEEDIEHSDSPENIVL